MICKINFAAAAALTFDVQPDFGTGASARGVRGLADIFPRGPAINPLDHQTSLVDDNPPSRIWEQILAL